MFFIPSFQIPSFHPDFGISKVMAGTMTEGTMQGTLFCYFICLSFFRGFIPADVIGGALFVMFLERCMCV
jgi:hypothetical protein